MVATWTINVLPSEVIRAIILAGRPMFLNAHALTATAAAPAAAPSAPSAPAMAAMAASSSKAVRRQPAGF